MTSAEVGTRSTLITLASRLGSSSAVVTHYWSTDADY
jgi:hypothetical protein